MSKRKKVPKDNIISVITQSKRRCCICYGLNRNKDIKKGQISHLDHNPSNYDIDNLAYLCLEHHDEYDGKTSQSKSFQIEEVKKYRKELYDSFSDWDITSTRQFINFLLSRITLDDMVDAAKAAAGRYTWSPDSLLIEVLTIPDFESTDGDLWIPHLGLVEEFHSWGWLDYTFAENQTEDEYKVHIKVKYKPVCKEVLTAFQKRLENKT